MSFNSWVTLLFYNYWPSENSKVPRPFSLDCLTWDPKCLLFISTGLGWLHTLLIFDFYLFVAFPLCGLPPQIFIYYILLQEFSPFYISCLMHSVDLQIITTLLTQKQTKGVHLRNLGKWRLKLKRKIDMKRHKTRTLSFLHFVALWSFANVPFSKSVDVSLNLEDFLLPISFPWSSCSPTLGSRVSNCVLQWTCF